MQLNTNTVVLHCKGKKNKKAKASDAQGVYKGAGERYQDGEQEQQKEWGAGAAWEDHQSPPSTGEICCKEENNILPMPTRRNNRCKLQ